MKIFKPVSKISIGIAGVLVLIALLLTAYSILTKNSSLEPSFFSVQEVVAVTAALYLSAIALLFYQVKNSLFAQQSDLKSMSGDDGSRAFLHPQISDNTPAIISIISTVSKNIIYINGAVELLTGYSKAEFMAGGYEFAKSLIHPEDLKIVEECLSQKTVNNSGKEYRIRHKQGYYSWIRSYTSTFKSISEDSTKQIISISIDITEQKSSEENSRKTQQELLQLNNELEKKNINHTLELDQEKAALRKEKERNSLVLLATNDVVRDWDLLNHQIVWNENYQKLFGYSLSEIHTDVSSWYNRIHLDDKDKIIISINSALDKGENQWNAEYQYIKADGSYSFILDRAYILRNTNGIPYRMVSCMTDITETKNALKKADRTEQKFRKIFESNMIGIFFADADSQIIDANDAFLKMIGYTKEELKHKLINWEKLSPQKYHSKSKKNLEQLLKNGFCPPYEKEYLRKDGTPISVLVGSALIKDDDAQKVTYVIDLSEKRETENKKKELLKIIQQQKKEFENILMNAPSLISVRRGSELRYTFVNEALKKVTGTSDYLGKTIQEVRPELKDKKGLAAEMEVLKTGNPSIGKAYPVKLSNPTKADEFGWFDFIDIPVYDVNGNIDGIASYGFDVTSLISASEEIKKSEDRFRLMADSMPQMVWTATADGKSNYHNKVWFDYTGISANIKGGFMEKIIHPDDLEKTANKWNLALSNQKSYSIEHRIRRHDGEYLWHISNTVPQYNVDGKLVMWVGTITNIHDQKVISDAIKVSEDHFRTLAEHTPFMIWQVDKQGLCTYVNKSWIDFSGLSFENSLNRGWSTAVHPDDSEIEYEKFMHCLYRLEPYNSKFRIKNSKGEYRWAYTQSNPLINETFEGYIGSITDITEQELAQQATRELMQKKDEFMSIASHELKTPITSMKASLQIAQRIADAEGENRLKPLIITANKQVNKLTRLVNDLLDVTKIQAGKMQFDFVEFNSIDLIKECITEIQFNTKTHEIIFNECPEIIIEADRNRLEQVITNFLSNAIKYSPGASKVIVKAGYDATDFKLEITDFGIGIPKDKAKFIFSRFFRVQESSQKFAGLGLGLYISSEIITRHSGKVGLNSEEGLGSTFWFSLPLTLQEDHEKEAEASKRTNELLTQLNRSKPAK